MIRTLWQDVQQPKQRLFGQRLAAARRAKGITQRELADRLNTTRAMVDYYERRAVNPLRKLCAVALRL
jgi:transcriptional regulator with XRE-family HTH domain